MKPIILILSLFFLFASSIKAQSFEFIEGDTINLTDENGLKQGHWIDIEKRTEGNFFNNKQEGVWKAYYTNKNIKSEITYLNGEKKGYARIYYEDGNIAEEGTWIVDKWVGMYKSYYSNGKLSYLWNYNDQGSRCGYQAYFYENGIVKIEGEWEEGKESGLIKEYFNSGSLRSQRFFESGKCNQKKTKLFLDGSFAEETIHKEKGDSLVVFSGNGKHTLYNRNNLTEKVGFFKNGILTDGKHYIYNDKNILIKTITIKNGKVTNTENH